MVVFLVATLVVLSSAVVPNILTQGRREREEETIWRGEQYERAIGLYFRKFGKYPTKVDDLTKQTNGVRFLRQAYTDPMNKEDGSWRFIYVGPNGQLIGSLRSTSLMQSAATAFALTGATPLGPGAAPPPPPGATPGIGAPGASQTGQPPGQQTAQQTGNQTGGGLGPISLGSQPQPLTGTVIGGNIIGVGSKIKESSLRVYEGGETYEEWEFIWNPVLQSGIPGQTAPVNPNASPPPQNQPNSPGTPTMQTAPGSPFGSAPGGPPLTGM
jgi:hypothetical protein